MGKRTYEHYIKNGCNPTGYNEACESIIFGQITVDSLLDEISNLKEDLNNSEQKCLICNKEQENDQLKQQLAKMEKELKEFKSIGATARQLQRAYQDRYKYNDRCCELKKQHIQNKINFAVEQLEKVRTQFQTKYSWYEETHRVCEKTDDFIIWLDNQIKELKEGKIYE